MSMDIFRNHTIKVALHMQVVPMFLFCCCCLFFFLGGGTHRGQCGTVTHSAIFSCRGSTTAQTDKLENMALRNMHCFMQFDIRECGILTCALTPISQLYSGADSVGVDWVASQPPFEDI